MGVPLSRPTSTQFKRTSAMEIRSRRISQLIPVVSLLRNMRDKEAHGVASALQCAIRDLERLNDIEALCALADDETGPTLWINFMSILEAP